MSKFLAILIAVLPLALSTDAIAAGSTWRCSFPDFDEPMTFLDLGNGQGKVVGNVGSADVWVHNGDRAISFMEPVSSGAVQLVTIVLATGDAAYTRNSVFGFPSEKDPSGFEPSWRRGKCKPWQ